MATAPDGDGKALSAGRGDRSDDVADAGDTHHGHRRPGPAVIEPGRLELRRAGQGDGAVEGRGELVERHVRHATGGYRHSDTPQEASGQSLSCRRRGGRAIAHRSDSNATWTVMADPESNPFCIS